MTEKRELKRAAEPDAAGWPKDSYSADLGHGDALVDAADTTEETRPLAHHEAVALDERLRRAADRVTVLVPGTQLRQGGTYLDLSQPEAVPFTAMAGQRVREGQLVVSKRLIDHETWNVLAGREQGPRSVSPVP